jgi:hypothetical protein
MHPMSAIDDRSRWLAHLHECIRCPVQLCDVGMELAAAVRDSMDPGETWEGIYAHSSPGKWSIQPSLWEGDRASET